MRSVGELEGDLSGVREGMRAWKRAGCLTSPEGFMKERRGM